jgi:hypothetical protein
MSAFIRNGDFIDLRLLLSDATSPIFCFKIRLSFLTKSMKLVLVCVDVVPTPCQLRKVRYSRGFHLLEEDLSLVIHLLVDILTQQTHNEPKATKPQR